MTNNLQEAVNLWYGSSNTENIIVVLIILLSVILLFFLIPYEIVEIKKLRKLKEMFFQESLQYGLSSLETSILWKYSKDYRWNPTLIFSNKKAFEITASKILKSNPSFRGLIPSIRHKLGFEKIPWFLPVSGTRDIDLYQIGKIIFNEREYEATVWENDDEYIYLALYNIQNTPIKVGDNITFSFITNDYAKAQFTSRVVDIFEDAGKIVYKIEHVDKVIRTPLREAFRIELNLKAFIYMPSSEELEEYKNNNLLPEPEEESLIEGVIKDLSIGGIRFCTTFSIPINIESEIFLQFNLYNKDIIVYGTIKNKTSSINNYCYGIKLENLTKDQEESIRNYIIEQQRLELKTYKLGEI